MYDDAPPRNSRRITDCTVDRTPTKTSAINWQEHLHGAASIRYVTIARQTVGGFLIEFIPRVRILACS